MTVGQQNREREREKYKHKFENDRNKAFPVDKHILLQIRIIEFPALAMHGAENMCEMAKKEKILKECKGKHKQRTCSKVLQRVQGGTQRIS